VRQALRFSPRYPGRDAVTRGAIEPASYGLFASARPVAVRLIAVVAQSSKSCISP
jgi:hypothetical protein